MSLSSCTHETHTHTERERERNKQRHAPRGKRSKVVWTEEEGEGLFCVMCFPERVVSKIIKITF